ncbi:MAG TPA: hypothetical protein VIL30_11040 [Ramlibacter sp.]|jgi:hypothetical protein
MKKLVRPLFAAMAASGLLAGAVHAQGMPELKFSGFGTLGVATTDEKNADFASTVFQPNGVGGTRSWSIGPDTKLGGQVDAVFSDRWSAVVQVVAQHGYNNHWTPQLEWANVKFQATPELSVRVGRIAAPSFLVSDSRFVGYAQPWVRPPVEVYGVLPITNNDGIDISWRRRFGPVSNTLQAYYGRAKAKIESGTATATPSWGINDAVQLGDLTLRAGYTYNKFDLDLPNVDALLAGISAFGAVPGPVGAQARALANRYNTRGAELSAFSLAASYDPGRWFAMTEVAALKGEGILLDSRSWYVTGGMRFGTVTPYATYARTGADVPTEPGIPLPAAAPLNAGLNATLNNQFNGTQSTASVGVRWDFMRNAALKAQYDHIRTGANSAGRLTDVRPGFVRGSDVNLFSVALDFVF